MQVFISQPMNGKSDDEIRYERAAIINEFTEKEDAPGASFIESVLDISQPHKNVGLHYLAASLGLMSNADVVCFAKGWENARGCRIEHECAKAYGIKIVEL